MRFIILGIISFMIISGCSANSNYSSRVFNGNPTAKDILEDYNDADIFQYNGLIYSNASDLKWVQEKKPQKGELIGEITRTTNKSRQFKDGVASKLPAGAKIYKTKADGIYRLLVEYEQKQVVYIALIEG